MAELVQYYGTGRRKTSVARVYLRPGTGDYEVNGRPFNEYFVTEAQRSSARQPLLSTETAATFNVVARVSGGGVNGQADAMKLGIARALMQFNAELRKKLKAEGMVTRDSRGKERKKYGQKGARKRFQFSKR
ncbi:MAG: 30S ribosomal protein S9 [Terriglobales bacterium]